MFNYVPERIYTKIKDDETYKEIVAFIESKKATCSTIVEYIKSDSNEFYGDKAIEYKTKLKEIINKYCPEYLIQYNANNGEYTRDQLLAMYKSKTYDSECNFFFLSNIINASYADTTYLEYIYIFVKDYEDLSTEELNVLSTYIHLKYMYGKIYLTAFNTNSFVDGYHITLFNTVHSIYTKILEYADSDTANNYVLEAIADSMQVVTNKLQDHKKLHPYMDLILDFADGLTYQYQKYSYAYAKILDMRNMICAYDRDYSGFLNGSIILCKYISTALAVPSKLFKGLNYYDKCNHAMFIVLIRRYIKLKNIVPMLRINDNVVINNLLPDDYTFALSNIININTPSAEYDAVVEQYRISVDNWFNSTNIAYVELKDIKI